TGRVRSDLGSFLPRAARAFEVFTNLLAPGAGCVEIFLCVSLDLRSPAPPCRNFVTKLSEAVSQLGLINRRGKLLGTEEALRLDCARLAIVALRDIENDCMRMQLWRDIPIDRTGCIVLKLGDDKFAGGLGRMIAADAGLRVVFELVEGNADALPVRFADTLIAADQRRERNRFGRGKGRIPSGPVLHRLDGLAVGVLIFIRRSLPHKLLAGLWMLPLAEFREVPGGDRPGKAKLPGQVALPFACDDAALRPVVLFFRSELLLVV